MLLAPALLMGPVAAGWTTRQILAAGFSVTPGASLHRHQLQPGCNAPALRAARFTTCGHPDETAGPAGQSPGRVVPAGCQ